MQDIVSLRYAAIAQRTCITLLLTLAGVIGAAAPALGSGRAGRCPDYDPQPTSIPRPETIWLASPNFGTRDNTVLAIDSVVIHTTEVDLAGTLDIFQNRANAVSSHFVIAPNGEIYEMVDVRDRAWHATYYNSRSIGIEMVGYAGQRSTWNDDNLGALVDLLTWTLASYPEIPLVNPPGNAYDYPNNLFDVAGLVAHGQVQPWNRSDPGRFFPWDDVLTQVADRLAAVPEPGVVASLFWAAAIAGIRRRERRAEAT